MPSTPAPKRDSGPSRPPAGANKRLRQTTLTSWTVHFRSISSSNSSHSTSGTTSSPHFRAERHGSRSAQAAGTGTTQRAPIASSTSPSSKSPREVRSSESTSSSTPNKHRQHRHQPEEQERINTPTWSRSQRKLNMSRQDSKPAGARFNNERAAIAAENLELIPSIISYTPASPASRLYAEPSASTSLNALHAISCPRHDPCRIRVVNSDSYDAAISLLASRDTRSSVAVLNMANAFRQGGGWLEGATAQEEQLCYRSTLIRTLSPAHYPLPRVSAVFSPAVAIFRASAKHAYKLYSTFSPPRDPEIVSVISVAAERDPKLTADGEDYAAEEDRAVMKAKIRILLRTAAKENMGRLVLGALGCGAFRNPNRPVAQAFRDVLTEQEFAGGWWEEVVFAVLDDRAGNFAVFREVLDGVVLGDEDDEEGGVEDGVEEVDGDEVDEVGPNGDTQEMDDMGEEDDDEL